MGGKNNKGGKSFKKLARSQQNRSRELIYPDNEQTIVRIIKSLGDGRFECDTFKDNDSKIIGRIKGSLRNRVWMKPGDFVIVSYRIEQTKNMCDILHKYNDSEAYQLKNEGYIPSCVNIQASTIELTEKPSEDDSFLFENI